MFISQGSLLESPPEYLLALLNKQLEAPPFGPMRRVPPAPPLEFSIVPADAKIAAEANRHFVEALRSLIDEWLDSGRSGTVETPRERVLRPGTSNTYTMSIWPERYGIWDILRHWLGAGRFLFGFADSGELELHPACTQNTHNAVADAKNDAIRLFFELLQSSLRYRIAKCCKPQCGRYFYYERMPKGALKCGTLCADHRLHGGTIRKDMQRKLRKEKKLALAADAWRRCKLDQSESYRWIANQVNKRLRRGETRITKRFITENADAIEELAEVKNA